MIHWLYALWMIRNDTKGGKRIADAHVIANSVASHMEKWQAVQETRSIVATGSWLGEGEHKQAILKFEEKGGDKVVLRDHDGTFRGNNLSAVGPVIEEIKALLRARQDHRVSWVRRSANGAAHALWFHIPPDCILQIALAEIPHVFINSKVCYPEKEIENTGSIHKKYGCIVITLSNSLDCFIQKINSKISMSRS